MIFCCVGEFTLSLSLSLRIFWMISQDILDDLSLSHDILDDLSLSLSLSL